MAATNMPSIAQINKMNKETLRLTLLNIASNTENSMEIPGVTDGHNGSLPNNDEVSYELHYESDTNSTEIAYMKTQLDNLESQNKMLIEMITTQQKAMETTQKEQTETLKLVHSMTGNIRKVMVSLDIDDSDDESEDETEAPEPQGTLLLGDDMIRGVEATCESLKVQSIGGAMIGNLRKQLKAINPKQKRYKDLVIVCGTHDAATNKPVNRIAGDYENLLQIAKERAENVSLSSIIPRLDEKVPSQKMNDLNDQLHTLSTANRATFINNDLNFKYADGSADTSLLLEGDKLHLSNQGTLRLLKNLKLTELAKSNMAPTPVKRPTVRNELLINDEWAAPFPIPSEKEVPPGDVNKTLGELQPIKFRGAKSPFSNLYMTPIHAWGIDFKSTEHGYTYYKALTMDEPDKAERILGSKNAMQAKNIGDTIVTNSKWESIKKNVMYHLLQQKAKQCHRFNEELRSSGDKVLLEDTNHQYWGIGADRNGQNVLGRLLMTIRGNLPPVNQNKLDTTRPFTNVVPRQEPPRKDTRGMRARYTPAPKVMPRRWHNGRNRPANREEQQNCFNCGEKSHTVEACRHPYPLQCYSCTGEGHKQKFCPWAY